MHWVPPPKTLAEDSCDDLATGECRFARRFEIVQRYSASYVRWLRLIAAFVLIATQADEFDGRYCFADITLAALIADVWRSGQKRL